MEIALTVPSKWAATRQRNGLEPVPFLAPPEAGGVIQRMG